MDLGDVWVIHPGDHASLRVEPRQDLPAIHAELDDLQCDPAADRLRLLREEDETHPPLAQGRQNLVWANAISGAELVGPKPRRFEAQPDEEGGAHAAISVGAVEHCAAGTALHA